MPRGVVTSLLRDRNVVRGFGCTDSAQTWTLCHMRLSSLIALALTAGCHAPRSNPTPAAADGAEVFSAQAYDVSPPLRELAKLPRPARPADDDLGEMEKA